MKTIITSIFLAFSLLPSSFAADQHQLEKFKSDLEKALKAKDLTLLNSLFYTKGASQYQIDFIIHPYEYYWKNGTLDSITLITPDNPKYNPEAIFAMIKGEIMNGHLYVPNLTPIMLCSVKFKDGSGSSSTVSPIGVDPSGSVKFVLQKQATQKAQQDAAANP